MDIGTFFAFLLNLTYWPLYRLIRVHLKRQFGLKRIRRAFCGAAPAAPELFEVFHGLGISEALAGGYISIAFKNTLAFLIIIAVRLICLEGLHGQEFVGRV